MRNKRPLWAGVLLCALLLITSSLSAQNRTITGTITDQNGAPLSGATIAVKGQPRVSTSTQANGTFRLDVPPNASALIVSYVGMVDQELLYEQHGQTLDPWK